MIDASRLLLFYGPEARGASVSCAILEEETVSIETTGTEEREVFIFGLHPFLGHQAVDSYKSK